MSQDRNPRMADRRPVKTVRFDVVRVTRYEVVKHVITSDGPSIRLMATCDDESEADELVARLNHTVD